MVPSHGDVAFTRRQSTPTVRAAGESNARFLGPKDFDECPRGRTDRDFARRLAAVCSMEVDRHPRSADQKAFEHSRITSTRCGWRRSDPAEPPPHVSDLRDTLVCRLGPGNPALVRVQSAGRSRSRDDPRRERVVSRIARAGSEVSRGPRPPRAGTVNLRPRAEDPVTTNRLEHGNRRHATVLTDRRPTREEVGQ